MGVISRRVVPLCGSLCIFCPAFRARSRQPVKRYKKFLKEIFPRHQDSEPNDRKIGKLCEYASKNPLRIPKITEYLEQRFYKDLRNEHYGSVKVTLRLYKKLLSSCKEQMPLFSSSLLGIVRTLLEQTRLYEIQLLGCNILVDFIDSQVDSTYMFNLEGLIPKFCQLAQEVGDNDRALQLRAAGLQALAAMVSYMGDHSHISMDFDKIISVTLENYVDSHDHSQIGKPEQPNSPSPDRHVEGRSNGDHNPYLTNYLCLKHELDLPLDASSNPSYWSRVCLHNMVGLAKEATTVRRVLDPFFHNFDSEDYWSIEKGLAFSILTYFQFLLEDSGQNSHFLLSILVKHLDHKNVAKKPLKQINIINVTTQLAQYAKQQVTVAIISALTDLVKHLRKGMQFSAEASCTGDGAHKLNSDLQSAIEKCIFALSNKIGDVGPILDLMAVVLENLPSTPVLAKTTMCAVYRTAQIISSLPNLSHHKKPFPDSLFHQLLFAMAHHDHETRVGAHYVLSVVLMPSLICPWANCKDKSSQTCWNFSSFLHGQEEMIENWSSDGNNNEIGVVIPKDDPEVKLSLTSQSDCEASILKPAVRDRKKESRSLRLSNHQISLLLTSIWVQVTSAENTTQNFEAIAHTYNIILLFIRTKNSYQAALVRCFQLAFSLRSISRDEKGTMHLSRRRSVFTLASCMLIFSARAGNLPELIPVVKSSLTDRMMDPNLELIEDVRLQLVDRDSCSSVQVKGSVEDDVDDLNYLLASEIDDQKLKEKLLLKFVQNRPEEESFRIKKLLSQEFSPDDAYPLGTSFFMETPSLCSPPAIMDFDAFEEEVGPDYTSLPDASGSQSDRRVSISISGLDVVGVNQLLESVCETARQVASLPASNSTPVGYDEVKNMCEALVTGKQQKMSVLQDIKEQQDGGAIVLCSYYEERVYSSPAKKLGNGEAALALVTSESTIRNEHLVLCSLDYGHEESFRLPPSSPYDKFLRQAGC